MRPILFHIGPLPIRSYGFMVFVGFITALFVVRERLRRRNEGRDPNEPGLITPDHVMSMSLVGLWVGVLGARVLFVLTDWNAYAKHPLDALKIYQGGMTAYGAILFGLLYMAWYCRRHGLSVLEMADIAAPWIAFIYAVGRIGCFLNGCCYGAPTNLPWACTFIRDGHPELGLTEPSHPVQLYSSAMNFAIFGFLLWRGRRPRRRGELFLLYVALFCVYRTICEQFRKGYTADVFFWGLTHAQFFNLLCLPVALYLLWRLRNRSMRVREYGSMGVLNPAPPTHPYTQTPTQ